MNLDLVTVFQRTQLALREQGWCQGEYAILHQGDQLPHLCLSAALLRGCGIPVAPTALMSQYSGSNRWTPNGPRKYLVGNTKTERNRDRGLGTSKQRTLLIEAIQVVYDLLESYHHAPDLSSYNDHPDRQLTEILEILEQAEQRASSQGDPPSTCEITLQPPRLTPEDRISLVTDYQSGIGVAELNVRYGVSTGTIYKTLRQQKIPLRRGNSKTVQRASSQRNASVSMRGRKTFFNDEQAYALRSEYESGASVLQLAAKYGCGDRTIRKTILYAGGQLRPPGGVRKFTG